MSLKLKVICWILTEDEEKYGGFTLEDHFSLEPPKFTIFWWHDNIEKTFDVLDNLKEPTSFESNTKEEAKRWAEKIHKKIKKILTEI